MAAPTRERLLGDDLGVLDPLLRAVERFAQPRLLDRLQQVVDGVHLEGAHGVLVVRRDERDERHRLLLQHPHDADAVEFRHLQIEQRQIRRSRSISATASLPDAASPTTATSSNDRSSATRNERAGRSSSATTTRSRALTSVHLGSSLRHRRPSLPTGSRISTVVPWPGVVSNRQRCRVAVLAGEPPLDVAQARRRPRGRAAASASSRRRRCRGPTSDRRRRRRRRLVQARCTDDLAAASACGAMPCLTAFSTSGWSSERRHADARAGSAARRCATRSRSSNRARSMSRYASITRARGRAS